jgi:hypothetical protein
MTEARTLQLAEDWRAGMRLGRNIRWDPRSLLYKVEPTGVAQTKMWDRKIPVLDQGSLGSCTGNATVGVLGSEPFYDTLSPSVQASLNETEAVKVYSLATQLDGFAGTYPPDDSGSSGLGAAQAAQQLGFISGYQHITSVAAAQTAILSGPFIVGTNWLSGMDNPDANGLVKATGSVRGGHEYECYGYDAAADVWHFWNSWGSSWGVNGAFSYSSADFANLLAQQGDATTFVPISQPAPVPTPAPSNRIPADWVVWAKKTLTLKWQTQLSIRVAKEIIAAAGQ